MLTTGVDVDFVVGGKKNDDNLLRSIVGMLATVEVGNVVGVVTNNNADVLAAAVACAKAATAAMVTNATTNNSEDTMDYISIITL